MKKLVEDRGGVPATTAMGKAWSLKALHPADAIVEIGGIPDEDALSTVFQHYQFAFNVGNPTPGVAGTWDLDVFVHPNPIIPISIRTKDSNNAYLWSPIENKQIGTAGTPWYTKRALFAAQVERYRLAYCGLTGHLDAAAISNQGMIAAAQYPLQPITSSYANVGRVSTLIEAYNEAPKTWDQLQTMPNAYYGTAKDGIYAVYKLSETCQDWVNARDVRQVYPYGSASGLVDVVDVGWAGAAPSMTTLNGGYPYGITGSFTGSVANESILVQRADSGLLHVSAKNLHQTSQLSFIFRAGYELQVSAGSPLTSFARISPQYDPIALAGYYAIARELKDAYPEDYNSWSALLPLIANVASAVMPRIIPAISGLFGGKSKGSGFREGALNAAAPKARSMRSLEHEVENSSAAAKERVKSKLMDVFEKQEETMVANQRKRDPKRSKAKGHADPKAKAQTPRAQARSRPQRRRK